MNTVPQKLIEKLNNSAAPPAEQWQIGDRLIRKSDGVEVELSIANILATLTFLSGRLREPCVSTKDARFIEALKRNFVWDRRK